jgi:uncharacterized protein (DUF1684 family)
VVRDGTPRRRLDSRSLGEAALDPVTLLDWRRRIFDLYRGIRDDPEPDRAWRHWREVRDELFARHPQSPLAEQKRASFGGLVYFDYDPAARALAKLLPAEPTPYDIPTSGGSTYHFTRFGTAAFDLCGEPLSLGLYWLEGYGGGIFLSFADATSGETTYGACRYLLDTVKGADLGMDGNRLVLDFNFAYNPSCAYDPRWVCPLAPPGNRLAIAVSAGERVR